MLISPEVRNAIHVGDRILEINGLPVGTMMEEEVGPYPARIPDTHGAIMCCDTLGMELISAAVWGRSIPSVQFTKTMHVLI